MMSTAFSMPTPDYWSQVLSRNASFDGVLFYAVTTTGIFCRPSCPSRRPRVENVRFFLSAEKAREAGFRACRRCRPLEEPGRAADRELRQLCRDIEENLEAKLPLAALAKRLGLSEFQLERRFKAATGVTVGDYIRARRFVALKSGLRAGAAVAQATYAAGFGSSSRVYENSAERLGMTPATYARSGAGEEIRFAVADSPLGKMLVARTAKGICRIDLGKSAKELEAALREEFSAAKLAADDAQLRSAVQQVAAQMRGERVGLDLPLDLKATAFQLRVWQELRKIPLGETASYSEIAGRMGLPKSARAVARACGSNRVAVVIPCHRVVRSNGELSGYKWGVERKKKLLEQESRQAKGPGKK